MDGLPVSIMFSFHSQSFAFKFDTPAVWIGSMVGAGKTRAAEAVPPKTTRLLLKE